MRHTAFLAFLTLAASACASSSSGTNTGTSSTPSAGDANPCVGAACQVVVEVESGGLSPEFSRKQANYKLYMGCPRSLGVRDSTSLRGVQSLVASRSPTFPVPGTLEGRYATIALFFGAEPQRYALIDFGANTTGTVNFGYLWSGNRLENDSPRVNANNSFMTRACR